MAKTNRGTRHFNLGVSVYQESTISTRPSPIGHNNDRTRFFDGDMSGVLSAEKFTVTGAATLSQPATGFVVTDEACAHFLLMENSSGHNESLTGAGGRTAIYGHRLMIYNTGQGGMAGFMTRMEASGVKERTTHFLANPSVTCFAGDVNAAADGVYIQAMEVECRDNGYDASCIALVLNAFRTNSVGDKNAVWILFRAINQGTESADVAFSVKRDFKRGLDTTPGTTADFAAITLKKDQRIYLNSDDAASGNTIAGMYSTTLNSDYIKYSDAASSIVIVVAGTTALQLASTKVISTLPYNTTDHYQVDGTQVISNRVTGWTAPSGTADRTGYNADGPPTVTEVGQALKGLIDDLVTHGVIGA